MATLASFRSVLKQIPAPSFVAIHYSYFVVVCLVCSVVFWASSSPHGQISYVDSLFVVVSGMTEAGLNTQNLSTMTTWQQTMLLLLILSGSTIWVSIWTVVARKFIFYRRFIRARPVAAKPCVGEQVPRRRQQRLLCPSEKVHGGEKQHATGRCDSGTKCVSVAACGGGSPCGAEAAGQAHSYARESLCSLSREPASLKSEEDGLADAECRDACGFEYHALRLLAAVVPLYFALWQLLGCLGLGAWIRFNLPGPSLANGINPWWLGIFNGVSAFNNSGMTLLDDNMVPFQESYFVLITMGLMILAGNTAYPIFLRFIFWSGLKVLNLTTARTSFEPTKLAIQLLLKDPRRIYTNLFPARPTWWLLFMVVCLNTTDWVLFEVLNLHNPLVGDIPVGPRILDGLFQALAVRSGGFYVVPISKISIGVQVLYVIMMYISVYPVVITMRQSNVYKHDSLRDMSEDEPYYTFNPAQSEYGNASSEPTEMHNLSPGLEGPMKLATFPDRKAPHRRIGHSVAAGCKAQQPRLDARSSSDDSREEKQPSHHTRPLSPLPNTALHGRVDGCRSFLYQQIHGQLAHDIWWLAVATLVIVIIESSHFNADPVNFSVFNIVFEVVSAYGTVGISVGVPGAAYSFSGAWYAGSKLVLCLVMLRGRHRGLPAALDPAISLPHHHYKCT